MEVAHESNVERFLFVGSISEYPSIDVRSEDEVWKGKPAQNDWFTGVQKRIGESQGEAYFLDTGWDAVRVIRPSNVYGPFDNFGEENGQVIPALISKLLRNSQKLQIIGDGTNLRDFIFADDVAYWALEALEKSPPNFPLNIGSGIGTSVKDIAENLVDILGGDTLIEYLPTKNSGDKVRILDIDRAKATLGFEPSISIKEGLKRTVSWIKTNENWNRSKYL
jgi:nucleoside-diphosphate-sugar epimerase